MLDALPRVRVVGRYGVGYDMIDVPAATDRGVLVVTVPDYCTDEVADHTLALLLACARHLVPSHLQVARGDWSASAVMPGVKRLADQTLGIVGLGRIGRAVARRAQGFGLRVLALDPQIDDAGIRDRGAQPAPFEELLRESDYVSLHAPLSAVTRHLIGAQQLRAHEADRLPASTPRAAPSSTGSVLDRPAARRRRRRPRRPGAEPPAADDPLRALDNMVLTPHAAFYSDAAFLRLKPTSPARSPPPSTAGCRALR